MDGWMEGGREKFVGKVVGRADEGEEEEGGGGKMRRSSRISDIRSMSVIMNTNMRMCMCMSLSVRVRMRMRMRMRMSMSMSMSMGMHTVVYYVCIIHSTASYSYYGCSYSFSSSSYYSFSSSSYYSFSSSSSSITIYLEESNSDTHTTGTTTVVLLLC